MGQSSMTSRKAVYVICQSQGGVEVGRQRFSPGEYGVPQRGLLVERERTASIDKLRFNATQSIKRAHINRTESVRK